MRQRYVPRSALNRSLTGGKIDGSAVAIRTIPANRISADDLSQISANLGFMRAGTLQAGVARSQRGARVVLGEAAYGIRAYDSADRLFFSLDWRDQSFRLGYENGPGVSMVNGNVAIDGECIIDGTLSARKIRLSETYAQTLIEAGYMWLGEGGPDDEDATGIQLNVNGIAGFSEGKLTSNWHSSGASGGKFRSYALNVESAGPYALDVIEGILPYVEISGGEITIHNEPNYTPTAKLRFQFADRDVDGNLLRNQGIEISCESSFWGKGLILQGMDCDEYPYVSAPRLVFRNRKSSTYPNETIRDNDVIWGRNRIELADDINSYPYCSIALEMRENTGWLYSSESWIPLRFVVARNTSYEFVQVDVYGLCINGGCLRFGAGTADEDLTDDSTKPKLKWNFVRQQWEFFNPTDGKWYTPTLTEVTE